MSPGRSGCSSGRCGRASPQLQDAAAVEHDEELLLRGVAVRRSALSARGQDHVVEPSRDGSGRLAAAPGSAVEDGGYVGKGDHIARALRLWRRTLGSTGRRPRGRTAARRRRALPSAGTTRPRLRGAVRSALRRAAGRRRARRAPPCHRAACAGRALACALCNPRCRPHRSCHPATAVPARRARRRSPRRRHGRGRGWRSAPRRSRCGAGPPCACRPHVRDRATCP